MPGGKAVTLRRHAYGALPTLLLGLGGCCGYKEAPYLGRIENSARVARPAARAMQQLKELRYDEDGKQRPYLHLVDPPPLDWDRNRRAPGTVEVLLQATGVPIDHYSYEAVERLRAAAGRVVLDSPDFRLLLTDMGEHIVKWPTPAGKTAPLP